MTLLLLLFAIVALSLFAALRRRPAPVMALASGTTTLAMAAPGPATVDQQRRTITGLAVPYGPMGQTSAGRLTFSQGSLRVSDPRRVKLLREHDQRDVVGFATALDDRADGLYATFSVPEGPEGDRALAEAGNGLRDAFSVGVQLDDPVAERLRRANGAAVAGAGALREVSLVSVPAFDDARVGSVAARADLVVSSWADPIPNGGTMQRCPICGHQHDASAACPTTAPTSTTATAATDTTTSTAGDTATSSTSTTSTPTTTAASSTPATTPDAPAPAPMAVAGAAVVTSQPATYTFDGTRSLVVDAWAARMHGDGEAASRIHRFNAELASGNPASVMALAAVLTRDADGVGPFAPQGYRADLMVRAINVGRPIVSRLGTVPLTSAQPFSLPVEPDDFDGVAEHVEGTAHAPEGTMTLADELVAPKAISGAFRLSRELLDQSNPALDRVAIGTMARDYARKSEARAIAAFVAKNDGTPALNVNTAAELRAALLDFMPDDDVPADFVAAGRSLYAALAGEVDNDGRPMLAPVNPVNAPGVQRGRASYDVDGAVLFRTSRVTAADGWIVNANDVLWGESRVQQFRFDEVEGPGVVKLALWAYQVAAVLRATGVRRVTTAAA